MGTELISLESLAERINKTQASIEQAWGITLDRAREAGDLLIQAKTLAGHGNWERWLQGNCHVSVSMARKYVQLAREWPRLMEANRERVADLGIKDALKLLSKPKPEQSGDHHPIIIDVEAVPVEPRSLENSATDLPEEKALAGAMTVDGLFARLGDLLARLDDDARLKALDRAETLLRAIRGKHGAQNPPDGYLTVQDINVRLFDNIVHTKDLASLLSLLGKDKGMRQQKWKNRRGASIQVYPEVLARDLQAVVTAGGWPICSLWGAFERGSLKNAG